MTPTALAVPPADADAATVRRHYIEVANVFAAYPYEVQATLCQTCCLEGENTCGKEGGYGRHRYCGKPCEAFAQKRGQR